MRQLRLTSRATRGLGFPCTPYLVDQVLVDTGFPHLRSLVHEVVPGPLKAICLTHLHEDHSGNAASLARRFDCPIYLSHIQHLGSDGLAQLALYRLLYWGRPAAYQPQEMPDTVDTGERTLRAVHTPGHSETHVALFDERDGLLFSGDLFITGFVSAVMSHENPYQSMVSLRTVADLEPTQLLGGHGQQFDRPARLLRRKADSIERAAHKAVQDHRRGLATRAIVKHLFPESVALDRRLTWMTAGEFSFRNFVRAAIRHAPNP